MTPKYAVYPGHVVSKTDLQSHYITAEKLIALYGVHGGECLTIFPGDHKQPWMKGKIAQAAKLIPLHPRYDGNYTLPTSPERIEK